LTEGESDETKARYAFVFGDFRRIHRTGLIACEYRAAEWRHKAIELAAHNLLQRLDRKAGLA
jgi:hydroxypyruvate isomerase